MAAQRARQSPLRHAGCPQFWTEPCLAFPGTHTSLWGQRGSAVFGTGASRGGSDWTAEESSGAWSALGLHPAPALLFPSLLTPPVPSEGKAVPLPPSPQVGSVSVAHGHRLGVRRGEAAVPPAGCSYPGAVNSFIGSKNISITPYRHNFVRLLLPKIERLVSPRCSLQNTCGCSAAWEAVLFSRSDIPLFAAVNLLSVFTWTQPTNWEACAVFPVSAAWSYPHRSVRVV